MTKIEPFTAEDQAALEALQAKGPNLERWERQRKAELNVKLKTWLIAPQLRAAEARARARANAQLDRLVATLARDLNDPRIWEVWQDAKRRH